MNNLFENFPLINYANNVATNILAKVRFNTEVFNDTSLYYPYTIKDGERPDHVAFNYYGDSRFVWAVYFSNLTLDPYYEWPLDSRTFKQYMIGKYESVQNAVSKTAFYRVAYQNDDRMLDQATYDALATSTKKYWRPVVNDNGSTLFFVRKEQTTTLETNRTVQLTVANTTGFVVNENVVQSNTSGGTIATGNIKLVDTTKIVLQHITGSFANTGGSIGSIKGSESNKTTSVSNTSILNIAIPSQELTYWEPISYYVYEDEINTSRKFINLLNSSYIDQAEKEIQDLMK